MELPDNIQDAYLGSQEIQRIYKGLNLLYQRNPSFTGFLDTFPDNWALPLSFQLLRAENVLNPITRQRRDSDDDEAEVLVDMNMPIPQVTLNSSIVGSEQTFGEFVGVGNTTTHSWYGQNALNPLSAVQENAANQPMFVQEGEIIKENGQPALDFNGISHFLSVSAIGDLQGSLFSITKSPNAAFTQANPESDLGFIILDTAGNGGGEARALYRAGAGTSIVAGDTSNSNIQRLIHHSSNGSAWSIAVNGSNELLSIVAGSNGGGWFGDQQYPFHIMKLERTSDFYYGGKVQEILLNSQQITANELAISNQINSRYQIPNFAA